jgi:hypothetical protein
VGHEHPTPHYSSNGLDPNFGGVVMWDEDGRIVQFASTEDGL